MVGAVIVALFLYFRSRLWNSKLVRGDYGVAATYWLFAFLGSFLVVGLAYLYIAYKVGSMESAGSDNGLLGLMSIMGALSAPATAAVVVLLYQIIAIVSVWRATAQKHVSFWGRWLTRYAICFNVFVAVLVVSFCLVGLGLGLILYFAVRHFVLKRKTPATELQDEIAKLASATPVEKADGGSVEIVLGDLSSGEPMLEQYVQCLNSTGSLAERIHVVPNISPERLRAAIRARHFAAALGKQKALLLIDDSRGFTGKEGLLVTDQNVDFKPASGKASSYGYRLGFDGFEIKGASIFRMGEECISFRNVDAESVEKVFMLLNSYFSDHRSWCERMANEGDRDAQFNMSMYAKSKTEALEWLRMAAERGHAIAQGNLGAELAGSNLEDSYYWLSRAAEQGNEVSIQRLSSTRYDIFR